jgi:damage-control phosphatase, subfamily I
MRTYFDCIPCFLRQTLDAVRDLGLDASLQEHVLRTVLAACAEMDLGQSPPVMGQRIHRVIREASGNADPYAEMKERFNRLALGLYAECRGSIERANDPLETALRLAIAGNVIDAAPKSGLSEEDVRRSMLQALTDPLDGDVKEFSRAVAASPDILYLADNAGEIVFDRLLIEQIGADKVTVAVKGSPVINDATLADAAVAGLTSIVEVIDNGSDAPGTILEDCSESFRQRFGAADLVLAKGQANYETLSETDRDIFFVLKAKCPLIARDVGSPLGSLVVRRNGRTTTASPAPRDGRRTRHSTEVQRR